MSYQILRIAKLKSFEAIKGSAAHNFREISVPNADKTRTHLNKTIGANTADFLISAWKSSMHARGIKLRNKNTVKLIEFLLTASPEFFTDKKVTTNYFNKSVEWIKNKFGKENVISINLQFDEKSPHLVVYVMPVFEGKLNAKNFFGGSQKMRLLQDDFHIKVTNIFGLRRGLKGSKAKHLSANKIYEIANQPEVTIPSLPKKNILGYYTTLEVDNYIIKTKSLIEFTKKYQYQALLNRELKKIKEMSEKLQSENERISKTSEVLERQNNKMMHFLSKLIVNFDDNLKAKIAIKLKLDSNKPLIAQPQKGSLLCLSKYSAYDAIEKIMDVYDVLPVNHLEDSTLVDSIELGKQSLQHRRAL